MEDKLRRYMDSLFEDAPNSKQAVELKEEILQNTLERYQDLLAEGKSQEAAFNIAVAGIGDVTELLQSLKNGAASESANKAADNSGYYNGYGQQYTREEIEKSKSRSALFTTIAIMLYILCVVPPMLLSGTALEDNLAPCLMFVMIAVATGLLIYNGKTKIRYHKTQDTMVEDFKEWKEAKSERTSLRKSLSSALWSLGVVVYLIVSFATGAWYITWVIFLILVAMDNIIKACFDLKG